MSKKIVGQAAGLAGLCGAGLLAAAALATPALAQGASSTVAPTASADAGSLTFHGVTLYGTVDIGVAYLTHGAPLSAYYGPGLPFTIQKFSNRPITSIAPNGLSQSKIGISGVEPITKDLSAVFKLETGFQPTSGNLADGPKSLILSNGRPLSQQANSGDSARAGQPLEGAAYAGLASKTWGVLTYGRQTGLVLDDLIKYDPQAQSQAFSPIGYSGVAGGGGDTEDTRLDSTLKYAVSRGPVRLAVLHQFGDKGSLPGGADQVDLGGDHAGFSIDAVYSHVSDAVAASPLTAAQAAAHPQTLAATISDNTTYSLQGKYSRGRAKFYAGYEHIGYENPAHPLSAGQTTIGGYDLSVVNNKAYVHQKILQISWVGVRYAITRALDLTGAYYRYDQNSYKGNGCSNTSASSCRGALNAMSLVADYKLTKRFDVYGGVNYSNVANGLAAGFLQSAMVAPMVGVRFNF